MMKKYLEQLSIIFVAGLILSGCYTNFNATSYDENLKVSLSEDNRVEIYGAYYYIDYSTKHWYSYHGIDLATDRNFLRSFHFSYHHPTSSYFYSPFKSSYFYNNPGYSNNFFYRKIRGNQAHNFYSQYYPPYYSNHYMYSFYYNNWAKWYYWDTAFPNYWAGSHSYGSENMSQQRNNHRTTELSHSDVFVITSRDRIVPPVSVETVIARDRNEFKRGKIDDDYRGRLNRNRSLHSMHGNFNRSNGFSRSNAQSNPSSLTRSFERVNRSTVSRSSEKSATVRSSSGSNRSSKSRTRSSRNNSSSSSSNNRN